jgi:predicted HicB family RNase H-like nuclease
MAKTETLNLRVSADFKRRLAEEAAKEKRSVTNYLEVTLAKIWERQDPEVRRKVEKKSRG